MYTNNDYENLIEKLKSLSNKKYSEFHSNLVPNVKNKIIILGIPVPKLRELAKNIISDCDDIDSYFSLVGNDFYEEIMLKGIVTGYLKCEWNRKLDYISDFVPLIPDWGICDVFCSSIKIPKKQKRIFRDFLEKYFVSEKEFEIRFAVVMLLQNYICDDFISSTLNTIKSVNDKRYYVQMALAWALSVCYVKFPELTLSLFKEKSLDKFVQNKAIQKCRESFRVSDKDKIMLLNYKIS